MNMCYDNGSGQLAAGVGHSLQLMTLKPPAALTVGKRIRSDFAEKGESYQKAVAFSNDGKMVVTGGVEGMLRVWKVPLTLFYLALS